MFAIVVTWASRSTGTWDDDCQTRYFNVRHAVSDARQFIEVWNRPLFVLLYVLPLQLGTWAVAAMTGLVTVATAALVATTAGEKRPYGWAAAWLYFAQPLVFALSFAALTEPLAALLLALAVWAHRTGRRPAFAIAGALLPLARLELSPLLLVWAGILLRNGAWRWLPVLAIPTFLWNGAGWMIDGDPIWLWNEVMTGQENRYGHKPFRHYFQGIIFMTGAVTFFFLLLGLFRRAISRTIDFPFVLLVCGFSIYVVFAWKLSVGHSAGFLRNLVPLAPLVALIAHEGLTEWVEAGGRRRVAISVASAGIAFVVWRYLSFETSPTDPFTNVREYTKLILVGFVSVLPIAFLLRVRVVRTIGVVLAVVIALGFTLTVMPPFTPSPEQNLVYRSGVWYERNRDTVGTLYVNHPWFFYAWGHDKYDPKFQRITHENLRRARRGDAIIMESHYSHRLEGDVRFAFFEDNPEYEILGVEHAGRSWCGVVRKR